MKLTTQLAKHFRDVYFGGNWTSSNLKENLREMTWQQATQRVHSLNSIALLVYHIHYFNRAVLPVLHGGALNAHDKYSFDMPIIASEEEWKAMLDKVWEDVEEIAALIEKLPEEKLWEDFSESKYGSYYRNISGLIEHAHYHLGQIAIIKKLVLE